MSIRAGGGRHPPNIVPSGHVPSAEDVIKCIVWLIGTYDLSRTIRWNGILTYIVVRKKKGA